MLRWLQEQRSPRGSAAQPGRIRSAKAISPSASWWTATSRTSTRATTLFAGGPSAQDRPRCARRSEAERNREVILAGSGGQGLVVSGILLAEAAILEGKNVVQTASYGIATRGGLSLAEVIIDDAEIIFQQVQKPDCVLALSEAAVKVYQAWPAQGVPLLYDIALVEKRSGPNFLGCRFTGQPAIWAIPRARTSSLWQPWPPTRGRLPGGAWNGRSRSASAPASTT